MKRMMMATAAGVSLASAVGLVGSERWLSASYDRPAVVIDSGSGRDEADWLQLPRPASVVPVVGVAADKSAHDAANRTFGIGTRLTITGPDRLTLDIVSAVPAPAGSGLIDGEGRPLIIVTARERTKGLRTLRLLVEPDRLPAAGEKVL